jgi:hypothetical protein
LASHGFSSKGDVEDERARTKAKIEKLKPVVNYARELAQELKARYLERIAHLPSVYLAPQTYNWFVDPFLHASDGETEAHAEAQLHAEVYSKVRPVLAGDFRGKWQATLQEVESDVVSLVAKCAERFPDQREDCEGRVRAQMGEVGVDWLAHHIATGCAQMAVLYMRLVKRVNTAAQAIGVDCVYEDERTNPTTVIARLLEENRGALGEIMFASVKRDVDAMLAAKTSTVREREREMEETTKGYNPLPRFCVFILFIS